MTDRLTKIFNRLPKCKVFADVGCDHGYIAKAMVQSGKCQRAIISDISAKCLDKAVQLLSKEIASGVVTAVVSDGFDGVLGCDLALIAGMGGEEICSIISKASSLPEKLLLQPMKNCDKVRVTVVEKGYKIISDSVFFSAGKFYDLISLEKGCDNLTQEEIEFGRDNVNKKNVDFIKMIKIRIEKLENFLSNDEISDSTRQEMTRELIKLKKYV